MLTGGSERTEVEYRRLLERAGMRLTRIYAPPPTPWGSDLIEAVTEPAAELE
jgi:hypothetical protein